LMLVPFIDRGRVVRVTKRTLAFGCVALGALGWTALTVAAIASTPKPDPAAEIDYSAPTDWMQLSPEELAGVAYFRQEDCAACHSVAGRGGKVGPNLAAGSIHKDVAWMLAHFKHPAAVRPGTSMPPVQLSDAQLSSLAAFLLKLNANNATALDNAPPFALKGALIFKQNGCAGCHMVNGVGVEVGPGLNGLSKRRGQSWIEDHFADPQRLSPNSMMPPYKLSAGDTADLTNYLLSLPE